MAASIHRKMYNAAIHFRGMLEEQRVSAAPSPSGLCIVLVLLAFISSLEFSQTTSLTKYPTTLTFVILNAVTSRVQYQKPKMMTSKAIVEAIYSMDSPGRFLKKCADTGQWRELPKREAAERQHNQWHILQFVK
eukprot:scaffold33594_cov201-Skeletonema_dohrnii-CCMP3373.AAC.7